MACSDVDGRFNSGRLTPDEPGTVPNDPFLTITAPPDKSGVFTGRFDRDNQDFRGQCIPVGRLAVITFTRTHPDGTKTEYTGLVSPVPAKEIVRIKGRFARTLPGGSATVATVGGDWETEKPT